MISKYIKREAFYLSLFYKNHQFYFNFYINYKWTLQSFKIQKFKKSNLSIELMIRTNLKIKIKDKSAVDLVKTQMVEILNVDVERNIFLTQLFIHI
jgi:hypothetical protein